MYNKYTCEELIKKRFYIKSKIISIDLAQLYGCPPSRERIAKGSRIVEAIELFFEDELPAFVALASKAPNVLNGLHSDIVRNCIRLINQQLDQQFNSTKAFPSLMEHQAFKNNVIKQRLRAKCRFRNNSFCSNNSFAGRKEVIERVSHFRKMRAAGLVQTGTGDEVLKITLNHPDTLTGPAIRGIRPLENGEIEKYNFSSDDAIDLHNSVFALQNQIFQEFTINKFLFAADVGDHISMTDPRAAKGADCPRKHFPNVSSDFRRSENQGGLS